MPSAKKIFFKQGCGSGWGLPVYGSGDPDPSFEKLPDPYPTVEMKPDPLFQKKKPDSDPTFEKNGIRTRPSKEKPDPDPNTFVKKYCKKR